MITKITKILSLSILLCITGTAYADEVEFRLEGAFLKPKSNVGAFDNSNGGNAVRGASVDQEMDSMESLKFSIIKPWNDQISIVGSIYTPMKGVMSPKEVLSILTPGDTYGVSGKFKMLLAQLGGEYTVSLSDNFHPFFGAGLAFAYFHNGGTESLLHPNGHAIEDFEIDNTLTGYLSAGAKYNLSSNFSLTGSITYMPLKTDAAYQFSTYVGQSFPRSVAKDELKLEINPIIFTLGVSWKF